MGAPKNNNEKKVVPDDESYSIFDDTVRVARKQVFYTASFGAPFF